MRNRWVPLLTAAAMVAGASWGLAGRQIAPTAAALPAAAPAWSPQVTVQVEKLPPRYTDLPPEQAGTAEQAVRAYLDTLGQAAHVPLWHPARSGTIGAEQAPFPRAYAYLHPDRQRALAYEEWLKQWQGVAYLGTVQVEPAGPNRFFVEVERVETAAGHGALAYHRGFFTAAPTPAGWRLTSVELAPEDLITVQLGGHQPWRHDLALYAAHVLQRPGPPAAAAAARRVVELTYPGERVRLARQVDGDWVVLERTPQP